LDHPQHLPDVEFKPLQCRILILEAGMGRRELIKVIAGAVAAMPLAARAQQAGPAILIGVLMEHAESNPAAQFWLAAFRDELARLGWKDGSNLRVELRWSAGNAEMLKAFATSGPIADQAGARDQSQGGQGPWPNCPTRAARASRRDD
jgi:hypothetical protein